MGFLRDCADLPSINQVFVIWDAVKSRFRCVWYVWGIKKRLIGITICFQSRSQRRKKLCRTFQSRHGCLCPPWKKRESRNSNQSWYCKWSREHIMQPCTMPKLNMPIHVLICNWRIQGTGGRRKGRWMMFPPDGCSRWHNEKAYKLLNEISLRWLIS